MPAELAADATHADIQKYIDDVLQEAAEDETPPEKGDSQRIAEDYDEPAIAEIKTGDEEDTAKEGESSGAEEESWLDDDLKAEVAAYGISDDELADFTSREELERALRFFDRSALDAGRKALAESEGKDEQQPKEPARDEQGRFIKSDPKDGEYEIGLDKEVYDEDLVDALTRMRDHYESRLDALESRFAEADAKAEEQHFDTCVDSLGHPDLFGTTGKENAKQLERRQDLHVAVKAQLIGLEMLGRPADFDTSLVSRVARMVFADELGKKDLKAKTVKLSKQSNGRMGGGGTKSPEVPETPHEWAEREYKRREELTGGGS